MRTSLSPLARRILPAIAIALIAAATAYAAKSPAPESKGLTLTVDSTPLARSVTGHKGITIHSSHRQALRDPTPVYSLRLAGGGDPAERIRALATVAPAYCVGSDINGTDHRDSPCEQLAGDGSPTGRYPIHVEAILFRAPGRDQVSGASATPLPGGTARVTCTFDRHHCPIMVSSNTRFGGGPAGFVNVGVVAWTRSTERMPPDRMDLDCLEVGRRCDTRTASNEPIPGHPKQLAQQPGQLSIARLGADYDGSSKVTDGSTRVDGTDVPVSVSRTLYGGVVAHSTKLEDLEPGDVLETRGTAELTGDGFDHLGASYWVLARSPQAIAAHPGTPDRYVAPLNGVNCLGEDGVLTDTKSGYCSATREPPTLPVEQSGAIAVPASAPSTMYLNYVVLGSDGSVAEGVTPTATVDSVSTKVACLPAPRVLDDRACSIAVP